MATEEHLEDPLPRNPMESVTIFDEETDTEDLPEHDSISSELVEPRTVITAGHCVYMRSHGGRAKNRGHSWPQRLCNAIWFMHGYTF